jgi:hypothetical protein
MYRESARNKSLHLSSHVLHICNPVNSFMLNQTQVIPQNLSKYKNGQYSELQEQRRCLFLSNCSLIVTLTFMWREQPLLPPQTTPHFLLLTAWVWVAACILQCSAVQANLYWHWFVKVCVVQLVAIKSGCILVVISIGLVLHRQHRSLCSTNIEFSQLGKRYTSGWFKGYFVS